MRDYCRHCGQETDDELGRNPTDRAIEAEAEVARLRAALAEREVETRRLKQDLAESQRGHADTIRLTVSFKQQLDAARAELAAQGARLAQFHDETRRERQVWRAEVVDAKAELAAAVMDLQDSLFGMETMLRVATKELESARAELAAAVGERDRALEEVERLGEVVRTLVRFFAKTADREELRAALDAYLSEALALAPASLQPGEASERERYRAALLQVRVWTSTPKGLTDRKAQLAAIKRIANDALAPPPPAVTSGRPGDVTIRLLTEDEPAWSIFCAWCGAEEPAHDTDCYFYGQPEDVTEVPLDAPPPPAGEAT